MTARASRSSAEAMACRRAPHPGLSAGALRISRDPQRSASAATRRRRDAGRGRQPEGEGAVGENRHDRVPGGRAERDQRRDHPAVDAARATRQPAACCRSILSRRPINSVPVGGASPNAGKAAHSVSRSPAHQAMAPIRPALRPHQGVRRRAGRRRGSAEQRPAANPAHVRGRRRLLVRADQPLERLVVEVAEALDRRQSPAAARTADAARGRRLGAGPDPSAPVPGDGATHGSAAMRPVPA